MNLRQALIYPYRSMPKLLQMVLTLGIVLIALVSLHHRGSTMRRYAGPNGTNISVTFRHSSEAGGFATVLIAVTWLTGYSLDVIRHVNDGRRFLPAVRFARNLKNGVVLLCSRVIWGMIALFGFATLRSELPEYILAEWIFNLAVTVVFVGLALEYQVAMARCALEDRPGRAFQIWTNVAILVRNPRKSMALAFSLAGLGLLYLLPLKAIHETLPWPKVWQIDGVGFVAVIIACVFALFFLIQHFSSLYLVAQFARRT